MSVRNARGHSKMKTDELDIVTQNNKLKNIYILHKLFSKISYAIIYFTKNIGKIIKKTTKSCPSNSDYKEENTVIKNT